MASLQVQVTLSPRQRVALDARGIREGKQFAELIGEAIDQFLASDPNASDAAFKTAFGSMPNLEVLDRSEWDRGYTDR